MIVGKQHDFEALYKSFDAPITDFDCGQLCAPLNGGVPVCCKSEDVIPVLYVGEFKRLLERTQLWETFQPQNAHERRLVADNGEYQLAVCKGVAHCERENRSLNCRSFPFLPYVDHDGAVQGLVYDYDSAEGKCPLVELPQVVTKRYISEALSFWSQILVKSPEEQRFYGDESAGLRRRFAREGTGVPVLVEDGIRHFPTAVAQWRRLKKEPTDVPLTEMDRPSG